MVVDTPKLTAYKGSTGLITPWPAITNTVEIEMAINRS
jgi:hypothetical protein